MKYLKYNTSNNITALTTLVDLGNMAYQVGDNKEEVISNRNALLDELKIAGDHLVFVHQTHSDVIKEVTSNDFGKGSHSFESGVEADALYTKEKGVALGIFHADCVPLFFIDETVPLIGVIHAGYPGTLKHITKKALTSVIELEHLNPDNIKVFIGPHRRNETYIINDESRQEILSNDCLIRNDKFDSTGSNIIDVCACNIPLNNIWDSCIDTVLDSRCYSAYKGEPIGRMASIILMK